MAVLDVQRQARQIGRIRIGQQVAVMKDGRDTGKTRPARLDTFRFTTPSRHEADAIAALYGGEVRDWERGQFEVITPVSEIAVTVPPRNAVISQWYEMWNKGGCVRRCDSQTEMISGGECKCPHAADPSDPDEVRAASLRRSALAKANPPQACKLVTRINVMIPDLPGLGVFRLDTGSYWAATESGDQADLLEMAREANVYLPAMLRIEKRQKVAGGKTTEYPVPVLEILPTFRQIATGQLAAAGITAQLPPAPDGARLAIEAPAQAPAPAARAPLPATERDPDAQAIYDQAREALSRKQIEALIARASELGISGDMVCTDRDADSWGELRECLRGMWKDLPRAVPSE